MLLKDKNRKTTNILKGRKKRVERYLAKGRQGRENPRRL